MVLVHEWYGLLLYFWALRKWNQFIFDILIFISSLMWYSLFALATHHFGCSPKYKIVHDHLVQLDRTSFIRRWFFYSLVTFVICSFISQVGPRPCIYLTCEHLNVSWILATILDERWRVKVYAWMISRNQLTECHTQIISEEFYIRFQARVDYQFMATNVFPCANWVKWNQHSNGRYLELASIVE